MINLIQGKPQLTTVKTSSGDSYTGYVMVSSKTNEAWVYKGFLYLGGGKFKGLNLVAHIVNPSSIVYHSQVPWYVRMFCKRKKTVHCDGHVRITTVKYILFGREVAIRQHIDSSQ